MRLGGPRHQRHLPITNARERERERERERNFRFFFKILGYFELILKRGIYSEGWVWAQALAMSGFVMGSTPWQSGPGGG